MDTNHTDHRVQWTDHERRSVLAAMTDVLAELRPGVLFDTTIRISGDAKEYLALAEEKAGLPHERRRAHKNISTSQILGSQWLMETRRLHHARLKKQGVPTPLANHARPTPAPAPPKVTRPTPAQPPTLDMLKRHIQALEARVLALEQQRTSPLSWDE